MNKNLSSTVHEISDDEVAFYDAHGWVKLDGLISRDAAAALLEVSQALMVEAECRLEASNSLPSWLPWALPENCAHWGST